MIINNPLPVLSSVEQTMSTDLVHHPCRPAGELKDFINSIIREYIIISTSIRQMALYVLPNLGTIQVR